MSVIADFTVSAGSFALERALTAEPDVNVEAERLATHSVEWVLPFLWVSDGNLDAFRRAMRDDPTVVDVAVADEFEDSALYRVQWDDAVIDLVTEMLDQHANIQEAKAQGSSWRLQVRFSEDEQVSSFQEHFAEHGHSFEVNRLYHPSSRRPEFGLTSQQRDTLVTASRNGYFDVPRAVSLDQLAEVLGVSSNAASQRIRRGSDNLIRNTLLVDETRDAEES